MIFIVIPVFNRWAFTKNCIQSLLEQSYKDFKIVVVDHGSSDGTSNNIKSFFPETIVLSGNERMWWAAATNVGVKYALANNADFVLTLNNDLAVGTNYLQNLINAASENKKSLIGSLSADKNRGHKIVYAGTKWNRWTAKYRPSAMLLNYPEDCPSMQYIQSDLLPGRGTLIPREAFEKAGIFDEKNFPHYAADEYFSFVCKKMGFNLIIPLDAVVYSEVHATGLYNERFANRLSYWKNLFTSIRSPLNLKYRWRWALKCTPLPPLYFFVDLCRIVFSQLKKQR